MNRIEFLAELERLLQDISAEERKEAVQYYQDYFEDAGLENEQHIIEELSSPKKVAETIKAGLKGGGEENGEYRETGYADIRFEERNMPASHDQLQNSKMQEKQKPKPWSNNFLKIFLIVAIIVVGAPIILPFAFAVVCVILALVFAGFILLGGLVLAAVAVAITGFVSVVAGIAKLFSFPALGLVACGGGLMMCAAGLVATVLLVKLCVIVFPMMFRGIVNLCRRVVHGKEEKAR